METRAEILDAAWRLARRDGLASIAMRAGDAMPCPADLDGNRLLDLRDISAFIDAFVNGIP